jgi:hypothetical protein
LLLWIAGLAALTWTLSQLREILRSDEREGDKIRAVATTRS